MLLIVYRDVSRAWKLQLEFPDFYFRLIWCWARRFGRRDVLSCEENISVEDEPAGEFPDGSPTTVQRSHQNFSRLLVSRFCCWVAKEFVPGWLKHFHWSTNLPLA